MQKRAPDHAEKQDRSGTRLDIFDIRILQEIQRDGRITKLALAERVGLSPTPCWVRLHRLEQAGVISGYHARVTMKLIAPVATVLMEIALTNHRQVNFELFERVIRDVPEIVACWAVGGGVDYVLKIVTRDIDAYQRLVDTLLSREIGIDRYFTYIITRTVKDEIAVPADVLSPSA